jgi:hypothetical protein
MLRGVENLLFRSPECGDHRERGADALVGAPPQFEVLGLDGALNQQLALRKAFYASTN